ncbi:MAG: HAMP domain-containing histidine kinase [Lachnospiraceae bacterium]|nr:HAMP domain-containing histidine kinase [Lachnospiraceae bacterium]
MKYRNRIVIAYVLIMLAALFCMLQATKQRTMKSRDMVAYNDEIHRIAAEYLSGKGTEEIEAVHDCKIVFSNESEAEIVRGYADYALVMDFAPDGEVIGKVIWHDVSGGFEASLRRNRRTMLVFWSVVFVLGLVFVGLLDWYLLKPTREMKNLAGEIAKGNLDVPLPIRKHNPFGNLVEGFDLMREELRASRERETEAEKAKKELVAELAHDIKTPVATIRATCEVLELRQQRRLVQLEPGAEGTADREEAIADAKDVLEKAQTISHKTDTIKQLMDNVFQTTLEELDRIEVNPVEESSTVIEEYFRNLKNYGNILLENPIPHCLVYMDRLRMEQVIDNVVGNSHKYAGTDIHVRFEEVTMKAADSTDAVFVRIRIHDDGPGAPEEELPMLMQKYYRGSAAKEKAGFGLGLYLVRSYMEKQGGGAEVYNENGFTVNLYLRKV